MSSFGKDRDRTRERDMDLKYSEPPQNHTSHYKPPVIHVIGSRPAESYVKFSDNHVTWDKPETHANHVTKPRANGRPSTRIKPWKRDAVMSNRPINNQYRQLESESSDSNAFGCHVGYSSGCYDDDINKEDSPLAAHRHKDISLLYPNTASNQNRFNDSLETSSKSRGFERPPGGRKLNMKIVDGHMIVTQSSTDDSHPFRLRKHESYMFVSFLVCFFFNCPVGTLSLCLSLKSQDLYDNGSRRKAKILATISLVISMLGMVTGVFTILALVFFLADLQEQKKL